MRKLILVLFIMPLIANSQTLAENKKDEFTNTQVQRTSYEILAQTMRYTIYTRISKLDTLLLLDVKANIGGKVFSISQGNELMFKIDTAQLVKLANIKNAITCTGCGARGFNGSGAEGIETSYYLSKENFDALKANAFK